MLRIFLFLNYYLQKRLSVYLGFYHTSNPLTLRWRWNHWVYNYERQKKMKRSYSFFRFKRLFQKHKEG